MRTLVALVRRAVPAIVFFALVLPAAAADAGGRGEDGISKPPSSGADHGHFFFYVAPLRAVDADGGFLPGFRPGFRMHLVHFGGGGEADVTERFGVGADFGGISRVMNAGTVSIISVNGYYHALGRGHALDPYFTGGVSGLFYEPHQMTGGPNAGAGLNFWSQGAFGATIELRRTFRAPYRELRIGVSIRQ